MDRVRDRLIGWQTDGLLWIAILLTHFASTPCFVVTTPVAMLHVAMPPERLGATCVYGSYVGPMLIHVRLLEAMLDPYSAHVELMLSQEQSVPFTPLPSPKGTRRFWIMSGPCWAYMGPMLGLC